MADINYMDVASVRQVYNNLSKVISYDKTRNWNKNHHDQKQRIYEDMYKDALIERLVKLKRYLIERENNYYNSLGIHGTNTNQGQLFWQLYSRVDLWNKQAKVMYDLLFDHDWKKTMNNKIKTSLGSLETILSVRDILTPQQKQDLDNQIKIALNSCIMSELGKSISFNSGTQLKSINNIYYYKNGAIKFDFSTNTGLLDNLFNIQKTKSNDFSITIAVGRKARTAATGATTDELINQSWSDLSTFTDNSDVAVLVDTTVENAFTVKLRRAVQVAVQQWIKTNNIKKQSSTTKSGKQRSGNTISSKIKKLTTKTAFQFYYRELETKIRTAIPAGLVQTAFLLALKQLNKIQLYPAGGSIGEFYYLAMNIYLGFSHGKHTVKAVGRELQNGYEIPIDVLTDKTGWQIKNYSNDQFKLDQDFFINPRSKTGSPQSQSLSAFLGHSGFGHLGLKSRDITAIGQYYYTCAFNWPTTNANIEYIILHNGLLGLEKFLEYFLKNQLDYMLSLTTPADYNVIQSKSFPDKTTKTYKSTPIFYAINGNVYPSSKIVDSIILSLSGASSSAAPSIIIEVQQFSIDTSNSFYHISEYWDPSITTPPTPDIPNLLAASKVKYILHFDPTNFINYLNSTMTVLPTHVGSPIINLKGKGQGPIVSNI